MKKTFVDYAIPSQKLKHVLHQDPGWIALEPAQGELLDKTCEFIAGVLSGRDSAWNELTSLQHLASSLNLLTVKLTSVANPLPQPQVTPHPKPIDTLVERAARPPRIAGVAATEMEAELARALGSNLVSGGASPTSA